ncbi:MAG: hypothetical protein WC889_05430 [Myxococcota bacterium]|jgi:hypothetical protein
MRIENKEGLPLPAGIPAGEDSYLLLSAKNTGREALPRITAILDSRDPLLEGREFHFGKIPPGTEKSAKVKIKVPRDYLSGISEYQIVALSGFKVVAKQPGGKMIFAELPRPHFSLSYVISDAPPGANGSGTFEPGETVNIALTLKNNGKGTSQKPRISIRNPGNKEIYIKNGRCEFAAMPPQKTESCSLTIEIKKEMREDRFALTVTAFDGEMGEGIGEKLVIGLGGQDLVKSDAPGMDVLSPASATLTTPVIKVGPLPNTAMINSPKVRMDGTVLSPDGFKDFYVKVNDKKVYFKAAPPGATSMPFSVELPLNDGINSIFLVGRKDDDLMSLQRFILTRPAGKEDMEKSRWNNQ